jgi:hypothetical protein
MSSPLGEEIGGGYPHCHYSTLETHFYHLCTAPLKTRYKGGSKAAHTRLKGVAYIPFPNPKNKEIWEKLPYPMQFMLKIWQALQ